MNKDFYHKIIINPRFCQLMSVFITVYAITLYPFIIARDRLNITVYNHEKIHLVQQRELWVVGFYLLYVFFWFKARIKGISNDNAYRSIPFEKEAYKHQNNFKYLNNRKPYAWRDFI